MQCSLAATLGFFGAPGTHSLELDILGLWTVDNNRSFTRIPPVQHKQQSCRHGHGILVTVLPHLDSGRLVERVIRLQQTAKHGSDNCEWLPWLDDEGERCSQRLRSASRPSWEVGLRDSFPVFLCSRYLTALQIGPVGRRDEGDMSVNIVVTTAILTKKPPVIPPLVAPTATVTIATSQSTSLSIVFEGAPNQPATEVSPAATPTRAGPMPPKLPVVQFTVSQVSAASVNLGGGNSPAGVDAAAASPTSSDEDYPYPGVWGASGPLTTDINAPTRPVAPSIGSVPPIPPSVKAPPPIDPAAPPRGIPGAPSIGLDTATPIYGPGEELIVTPVTASTPTARVPPVIPTALISGPRGPPPIINGTVTDARVTVSTSFDLGYPHRTSPTDGASYLPSYGPVSNANGTGIPTMTTSRLPICQPSDLTKAPTSYSIVYTSTITWVGDPTDYTPEFPLMQLPTPTPTCVTALDPARLTISTIAFCSSTGAGTKFVTCLTTTATFGYGQNTGVPTSTAALMAPPGQTVIIITTDKNPAVVYSTPRPPNYGVTSEPGTRSSHNPATGANGVSTPIYDVEPTPNPPRQPPATSPVTVAVQPTAVVINGNTIIDDASGKTQTVIVSGVTFTIGPSQVIGGGATIDRPAMTGGVYLPTPTTTNLGGMQVVVSSSVAVVGGTSFTLGPTTRTTVVNGQTVVIAPTAVAVGTQTFTLPTRPAPTEEVVVGGDLVTAIGQSVLVIRSTTITYGTSSSTTVIDNDTLVFGPGGVTVHGTTLGGKTAKAGETDFAIVGGATITKVGASVVVINSVTYTVGPGTGSTTTVVAGETITIGPNGVSVSTLSLVYPFGPTTIITPGATPSDPSATSTAAAAKDMAAGLRPDLPAFVAVMCMAIGFMVLSI